MAHLLTEIPDALDVREIWLTSMLLLGFDPIACEEKYKIPFTRDMFVHINKKGMEVAMHFLFSKLDSHLSHEEFRDCWPVYDKKQEQQFRKACANWLAKIAKDDLTSKLPRIAAPLLLSPGGDKFYQFIMRFSVYVLKVVCLRDAKPDDSEKQVFIPSFLTSSEGIQPSMKELALEAIKAHIVRHTGRVTDRLQQVASLHDEWKKYASHLISEYRKTSKENRELTQRLESLKEQRSSFNRTVDSAAPLASPEAEAVKRKARIGKVREMWRNVEEFESKTSHQREEVEAVLEQKGAKHTIVAKDIAFQISDLIFRNYEKVIQEGKIINTYHSGKLSLSSLIQVWNCALSILKDHLCDGELPSLEDENLYMNDKLQGHKGHSAVVQTLRVQLGELQVNLSNRIEEIAHRLEERRGTKQTSPLPSMSAPALGFGLLPPSPVKSFDSPDKTLMERLAPLSPPPINSLTPEAIHNISHSIHAASRQALKPKTFTSQIPRRPTTTTDDIITSFVANTPTASTLLFTPRVVPKGAANTSSTAVKKSEVKGYKRHVGAKIPAASSSRRKVFASQPEPEEVQLYSPLLSSSSCSRKVKCEPHLPCSIDLEAENDDSVGVETANVWATKALGPHDLLADQIAAEVAMGTAHDMSASSPPGTQLHSFVDPLAALGTEAFLSRDKVPRTPCTKGAHTPVSQSNPDVDNTPLHIAGPAKAPEETVVPVIEEKHSSSTNVADVSIVEEKPSLTPEAKETAPNNGSFVLNTSASTHRTPLKTMEDTSLSSQTPHLPPELTMASSHKQSSAGSPHQSRMIAFESPFSLLPSSPSSPPAAASLGRAAPNMVLTTPSVAPPSPTPPLAPLDTSPPPFHVSSTPFLPAPHTAVGLNLRNSSHKLQPLGSLIPRLREEESSPAAACGVTLSPSLKLDQSNAEYSPAGGRNSSKVKQDGSQDRHTVVAGKSEASKLDFDLLDFSSPRTAPTISEERNLLEFSPRNLSNHIPDQRAAMEEPDVTDHGIFDSDDGSSLLASLSTNSSQCSPTEAPE